MAGPGRPGPKKDPKSMRATTHLRLPKALKRRARAKAKREYGSLSNYVRVLIETDLGPEVP